MKIYPDVSGQCPACGKSLLYLADGGHVTCSASDCPQPSAAAIIMSSYPKRNTFSKGWCSGSDYDLIPEVTASRGGIRFPTEEEMLENENKAKAATREHPHHFGPERELCFICKEVRRLEDEKHIEQLRSEHDGHQDYVEECPTCEEDREKEDGSYGCQCCERSY